MTCAVGIIGLGASLPDEVRSNEWWPESVVRSWRERATGQHALADMEQEADPGVGAVVRAIVELADDPFHGSRERRVLDEHRPSSDMEVDACREAIERAGVAVDDIDFVLGQSAIPDHLAAPNACAVHHRLGLRSDCLALSADASFDAFSAQMTLARALIATGSHRVGLLFQSSAMTRIVPADAPYSPWFGDAATAAVVARVRPGYGLLGAAHGVDGSLHRAMVAENRGRPWYGGGRVTWHPGAPVGPARLLLGVVQRARAVIEQAVQRAGVRASHVDFFAAHQPTRWFRGVTQECAGLHRARFLDTFPLTASLGAANVPFVLHRACARGLVTDGDIVVAHTGGLGATWSALILRWGR